MITDNDKVTFLAPQDQCIIITNHPALIPINFSTMKCSRATI